MKLFIHTHTHTHRIANRQFVCVNQVKVSRVYVRDTTVVSAFPLLLFGGDIAVQHLQKMLVVDNWIRYKVGSGV